MLTGTWPSGRPVIHPINNSCMSLKNSWSKRNDYYHIPFAERLAIIERSCKQVSRGVFFSTIIIIASFLPVFLLTGQEGNHFHPLAYNKTFILLVYTFPLSTLPPALISFCLRL